MYSLQIRRKSDTLNKFRDNIRVYNKLSRIKKATKDLFPNINYDKNIYQQKKEKYMRNSKLVKQARTKKNLELKSVGRTPAQRKRIEKKRNRTSK